MSLFFGNLTQEFVSFGTAELQYFQHTGNATAFQELQAAAAHFRSASALDASYLVYIGILPSIPSIYSPLLTYSQRHRYPCLHIHLHGYMGLYRRSKRQTHS